MNEGGEVRAADRAAAAERVLVALAAPRPSVVYVDLESEEESDIRGAGGKEAPATGTRRGGGLREAARGVLSALGVMLIGVNCVYRYQRQ